MKRFMALIGLCALAGCAAEKRAAVETQIRQQLSPGCYTVDLFDPYTLEPPAAGVSAEDRKFLGVWKNGAWGGSWCHDLYITKIEPDGSVELLDAYGPSSRHGHQPTVFKRKAQIKDGVLSFRSHGSAPVEYRIVGDFLVGERRDSLGKFEITMSRTDGLAQIPIPPEKPVRRS